MKKLSAILLSISLSACVVDVANIPQTRVVQMQELCHVNQGLKNITVRDDGAYTAHCNNGAYFHFGKKD